MSGKTEWKLQRWHSLSAEFALLVEKNDVVIEPQSMAWKNSESEEITRIRHYTNRKGSEGIKETGIIMPSDQNTVFAESANRKVLSPRDAEAYYGLKFGRGRDYIETSVETQRIAEVKNPITGVIELRIKGSVKLSEDAKIVQRK